ncbi:MAG: S8 family serine peptidase, partial [Prolixibacteraceae bacterium]
MTNLLRIFFLQKSCIVCMLCFFLVRYSHAQHTNRRIEPNQAELIQFAKQKSTNWLKEKKVADSVANALNIPISYIDDNSRVVILQNLGRNNKPIYYATDNISSASTISVDQVWTNNNEYPWLTGEGIEINIWDGGSVLSTHQELQNGPGTRIDMRDTELSFSNHSTHIAGTMVATGVNSDAKGMAGKATIKAWDLNDDLAEMASAAADGIVVSNHSYGPFCGWYYNTQNESWYWYGDPAISATEDYEFGFYNQVSADLDYIARLAPYYLIVKSAGNDRNDAPTTSFEHYVWDGTWVLVNVEREPDGGMDGFDCLSPMATAKNILTVGAVDDAKGMTSFSAFGPTDDGRIKPDVVANGYDVYSSVATSDNSYLAYSGTSMSTASATGSVALLNQLQNLLQPGVSLLSSSIKGILIHTATDGGNVGPDYCFGWGTLNIKNASDLIYSNSNNQGRNIYEESLSEGEQITIPVHTTSSSPFLKATLCWTDVEGQPSSPSLNQRNKKLVNDLNLSVENSSTLQLHLPWCLNVDNPAASATHGINQVDNVEEVYLANPGESNFNIKISHSGSLSGSSQMFSLIISGIEAQSNIYPPQNLTYVLNESGILLSWNLPVSGTPDSYKIYRNGSLLADTETNNFFDQSVIFDQEYSYYVTAVYYLNNEEIESLGTNQITVFPQTLRSLPFIVDFENEPTEVIIKNTETGWQWGDSESLNCYYLDFSDNTTKFIGIDSYSVGDAVHVTDVASTAPLRLAEYSNIVLSFDYLLKTGIYDAIDELHVVYKLQEEQTWHDWIKLESSFNWKSKTIELPPEICKNGTQIGFYYDDFYQWGMGAGLDNIKIEGVSSRAVDFSLNSLVSPVSSCILSESESVSVAIKNVGSQMALPGDNLSIQMYISSGINVTELLILQDTLHVNDILIHKLNTRVDLSQTGNYVFEFIISSSIDFNESNNTLSKSIDVYVLPTALILNTDLTFCENEQPILVEVSPAGGILSGAGVSGLYFDPILAGVGPHVLTYTVTDANGCVGTVTKAVQVIASP